MKLILPFIPILLSINLYAQSSLYMPKEFKKAYENKTRSYDGNPGEKYWQNNTSYTIEAEVEPGSWKLKGSEKMVYKNHSPDSLTELVIRTYANHYKKGAARAVQLPIETLTDGMILTDFTIDQVPVSLKTGNNVRNYSTYTVVRLNEPVPPGSSVTLEVKWTTEMPSVYVNRIGAYDNNSAFFGYWYPQIGRYDDIDGWDRMEYLASQEFNNDFADFDVKITVPGGFNVWATGTLQNPEKVLTVTEMRQYLKAKTSGEAVTIIPGNASPVKSKGKETWHYIASNVKDFGFGMSNTFKWIGNTVSIDGKEIFSNVVFDMAEGNAGDMLLEAQEKSLVYTSTTAPGIPYPYPAFTTFVGVNEFDGMEFPMIANNGMSDKAYENAAVTFHELAHTYFPFLVGINEVKYSWMEEGWANYFTIKFIQSYFKGSPSENAELNRSLDSYNRLAGSMWDLPLITPSFLLTYGQAHGLLSYRKSSFMYFTLENILGEATFQKCLQSYIHRWSGKHPTPYDFMFTFDEISQQNLEWFWNAWIFQPGYADLELSDFDKKTSKVNIKNIGGLPVPVILKLSYKNGTELLIENSAAIWSDGKTSVALDIANSENLKSVRLVTSHFPDADLGNNLLELERQ
ncbi:MAG: M1 family metallopeptidase [Saprospiraceae bacterium]|nr:M1 family metallopeptidase [Saprospiraceae bacterium]